MKQAFEVRYSALQAPLTMNGAAVVFGRAVAAMVDSCYVRNAGVPMFFNRDGFGISVTCQSRQALEGLPLTYGSVIGHFGELERGEVYAVPTAENFQSVFAFAEDLSALPVRFNGVFERLVISAV
jgi:hypothetical protein